MARIKKKMGRLLIKLAFVLVLLVITLVVLFVSQKDELDFNQIADYFKTGNLVWIVGAFGCMLLFIVFEGLSIFCLSRFFGSKPKVVSCVAYSSANAFYTVITPTGAGGQPAEVFYMSRDGMSPGKASFVILLNTIGYTASIFVVGIIALCINASLFVGITAVFAKVLIIFGIVVQLVLLGLFIGCMFFGRAIIKMGNGLIKILHKIRIVKNPDKWYAKIKYEVTKYGECRHVLREKPLVVATSLFFNVLQRIAQNLIPCFVCLAIDPNAPFFDIFALQVYVLFGYNSTPLPGGVGAYEYLFMCIYGQIFPETSLVLLVLMISRLFSYYITMILSGIIVLVYHMVKAPAEWPESEGESKVTGEEIKTTENQEEIELTETREETEEDGLSVPENEGTE